MICVLIAHPSYTQLETLMKAVGYKVPGPIAEDAALVDIDLPRPVATGCDILVEVKAVSVNPVDYKIRNGTPPANAIGRCWDGMPPGSCARSAPT
jgi:hypothetical protein